MHHAFLYISLLSLHDYDMKMKTSDDESFFLFLNLSEVSKNSTPWKFAYIWHFQRIRINTTKFEEREFILKVTFLVPSPSLMLKLPRLSVKWWWMKLKLSIVAETVYCIVLFQFLWCQRKFDGGGLKKNEGTCTYGVVSGRSGSGLYGIWWWNGWVTRRDPGNEWYGDLTWKW